MPTLIVITLNMMSYLFLLQSVNKTLLKRFVTSYVRRYHIFIIAANFHDQIRTFFVFLSIMMKSQKLSKYFFAASLE